MEPVNNSRRCMYFDTAARCECRKPSDHIDRDGWWVCADHIARLKGDS